MRPLLLSLLLAGCPDATFHDGEWACLPETGCPEGFTCGGDGLCHLPGWADAGWPDAPAADAAADAPAVDAGAPDAVPATRVVMFLTTAPHNGDFYDDASSRYTHHDWVRANLPAGISCDLDTVRAFLSVSSDDCLRNMPVTHGFDGALPIYLFNATANSYVRFADSWAEMIDGVLLTNPNAGLGEGLEVWSGSSFTGDSATNGTLASETNWNHCNQWTSSATTWSYRGAFGRLDAATMSECIPQATPPTATTDGFTLHWYSASMWETYTSPTVCAGRKGYSCDRMMPLLGVCLGR